MAISLNDTIRDSNLDDITTAAGAASHLLVYAGTVPAKTASPSGNTLLATFVLANPIAPAASAGSVALTLPSAVTAAASGTPSFFRIIDGATDDGTHTQVQGTAAVGSGDLDFASTVASGGQVSISSFTFTAGNS